MERGFPMQKYLRRHSRLLGISLVGLITISLIVAVMKQQSTLPHQSIPAQQPVLPQQQTLQRQTTNAVINASLQPPRNLTTVSLDSTIRANWTPPTDPHVAWQVFSVWDQNNTLISAKLLGKTAKAADGNGLAEGAQYTITVQSMDASGALSEPIIATAKTDLQSPMPNAAFFENFQDTPPGNLNYNYFDVRTSDHGIDPDLTSQDEFMVFANERHFHTQVIGGEGSRAIFIRPRVPFDFTNRTGTMQFEVDLPPVLKNVGKWFEVIISKDLISNENELDLEENSGSFVNSVTFGFFQKAPDYFFTDNPGYEGYGFNIPVITINSNGTRKEFDGTPTTQSALMTPTNVRMPITFKLSQTSAELFVDGKSVLKATGFTLPFTRGNIAIAHRSDYGTKVFEGYDQQAPPLPLQLLHWDTIQYDGPPGSFNPVVKTYIQSGCPAVEHVIIFERQIEGCHFFTADNATLTYTIPDDTTQAKTARLTFDTIAKSGSGTLSVNGNSMPFSLINHAMEVDVNALQSDEVDFPAQWLHPGTNTFHFTFNDNTSEFIQAEVEVIYNQHRVIANPPVVPPPQIGLTTQAVRVERITTDPMVKSGTTYLYSLGSAAPVNYSLSVVSGGTPWLKITSPTTGRLISPALGGKVIPINFSVDFSMPDCCTRADGNIAVIKITGGAMPMYVAIIADYYGLAHYMSILNKFPATTIFKKDAIIGFHSNG